ncbi:hypothetical protein TpMuguga_03g00151 [Theileria parva strain Muguga]|nr:uncharacterized protein TpMuguga_03g00151 [Theileria parva strain Muguga]EAN30886.1 hypothetical protein TpMuguga_03g00151 [Theileria parva strain Muguga]|eukprot:XP_763169.1 hypothetical protein [Theileria parva strain Muguga]
MEVHEHRGLRVYFFNPLYDSGVDKVVVGNQNIWAARPGQKLTRLVGFFRCMGFGLSHVSYFNSNGDNKELLLGYSHGSDFLEVVDKEKFYNKLLSYTNKEDKYNPEIPAHPVLHELEHLLSPKEEEVPKESVPEKERVEVPVGEHAEL